MLQATSTPSKIPVLKKVKILNPIKPAHKVKCYGDQFKYCRNCCILKENLSVIEQNLTTLLKENNYLRQQLAISKKCSTENVSSLNHISPQVDHEIVNTSFQSPVIEDCNLIPTNLDRDNTSSQPFLLMPGHPFCKFDANELDQEIVYSHHLSNRKIKFYGDAPYKYGEIIHEPCEVPGNSLLLKIIEQVKYLFPHYSFNSILVNKYDDGNSHIPMHSDDEECIKPNSSILTISLGETRTMKFHPKDKFHGSEIAINLQHGDVFTMSSNSQSLFKHGISKDNSRSMRISLTFRDLINCSKANYKALNSSLDSVGKFLLDLSSSQPPVNPNAHVENIRNSDKTNSRPQQDSSKLPTLTATQSIVLPKPASPPQTSVDTIYISSSMFADLNDSKLSSNSHKTAVFFYRGATAGGILHRLQNDQGFKAIDTGAVRQIFLLTGTNNVDNILNVHKSNHSNINIDFNSYGEYEFERAREDIYNLVHYLNRKIPNAKINILNILPRASISRNMVINNLNQYLQSLCAGIEFLSFINTEFNVNLFSSYDGYRKNKYFKDIGSDNVHLNRDGIVRLGKHLKYLSHLDCPRMNILW